MYSETIAGAGRIVYPAGYTLHGWVLTLCFIALGPTPSRKLPQKGRQVKLTTPSQSWVLMLCK